MNYENDFNLIIIRPINTKKGGQLFKYDLQKNIQTKKTSTLPLPTSKNFDLLPDKKVIDFKYNQQIDHQLSNNNQKSSSFMNQMNNLPPPPPPMPTSNSKSSKFTFNTNTSHKTKRKDYNRSNQNNQNLNQNSINLKSENEIKSNHETCSIHKLIKNFSEVFSLNNANCESNSNLCKLNCASLNDQINYVSNLNFSNNQSKLNENISNSPTDLNNLNNLEIQNSNNFFSLPYHQVNNQTDYHSNIKHQSETLIKYPSPSLPLNSPTNFTSKILNEHKKILNKKIKNQTDLNILPAETNLGQINFHQPNYNPTLSNSILNVKQNLQKELRNELSLRLRNKNNFQTLTTSINKYLTKRKPSNNFYSQLYFLFHLSFTLCLLKVLELDKENKWLYSEILNYYFSYLLATAIIFILVLGCCKNPNFFDVKEFKSDNTSILFGCISLGLVQLITIGLDFTQCLSKEILFLPILQFIFTFLLMYFILIQIKDPNKYIYNNIAVAHLLLTQISIWLSHFSPRTDNCRYFKLNSNLDVKEMLKGNSDKFNKLSPQSIINVENEKNYLGLNALNLNRTIFNPFKLDADAFKSTINLATSTAIKLATNASSTLNDFIMPIIHHHQILTIFILISIWLNNNKTKNNLLPTRLNTKDTFLNCFNSANLTSNVFLDNSNKLKSIKGFFLGLFTLSTTIVILLAANDYITILTHSCIQAVSSITCVFALIVRGNKKKGLHELPSKLLNPNEFHLFVIISLLSAYFCSFSALILNLMQKKIIIENLIDSFLLLFQITFQTILLRNDGRRINRLRNMYAFLIFANFSLWILEITEIAYINGTDYNLLNLSILPQIIVSLNRFYSALSFIHLWKIK